jgi:hypothetical protein
VAAPVGEHLLAALHSESVKALAAQLQQLVALGVAQLLLGYVFPQDPAGYVLRGGGAGCCLANPWPRSSMSIRGWSMWLMRMRLAM